MQASYEQLLDRISRASGLTVNDIERKIEAKRAKLSGLVSKEGAAQIVAAELGVNFEKQKSKISELATCKKANFTGKVIRVFPVKSYKKENREGKIGSMIVADETGNTRVVLWDVNHIKLIEQGNLKEGNVIEINNAQVRNNEVHLTGFSDIKTSQEIMENVKTEREFSAKKLQDVKPGDAVKLRAFVVQAFEPKFFDVCPECLGRAVSDAEGSMCEKHGRVVPEKRALITVVLDDGTENTRAVLFSEQIPKIGLKLEENFTLEKEKLLGRELFFSGTIRQNKFFNNQELFVSDIGEIDLDKLVESLEKR